MLGAVGLLKAGDWVRTWSVRAAGLGAPAHDARALRVGGLGVNVGERQGGASVEEQPKRHACRSVRAPRKRRCCRSEVPTSTAGTALLAAAAARWPDHGGHRPPHRPGEK